MERLWLNNLDSPEMLTNFTVLLSYPEDWIDYQRSIDRQRDKKYTHFGIPRSFPCLVISIEEPEEPLRYFEHRFIYPDIAGMLIEQDKVNRSRFNLILNERD